MNVRGDAIGAAFSSGLAAYLVFGTGAINKPGSAANIGFSLNMAGMYLPIAVPPRLTLSQPVLAVSFCGGFGG